MAQSKSSQPELIETVAISDVFATDIGKIERVSPSCNRFYLCVRQDDELHVVAKVIIPSDCLAAWNAARERLLAELGPFDEHVRAYRAYHQVAH